METYVALLRGVNLGARNRVSMPQLRELVEAIGGEEVRTYLQSGNVVLRSRDKAAELERALEQGLGRVLGVEAAVLVRTKKELKEILERNPFEPAETYVTFIESAPDSARVSPLREQSFEPDQFYAAGREVYVSCPGGYGRTKLSNTFLERRLAVQATTRNWRTVTALAELADA